MWYFETKIYTRTININKILTRTHTLSQLAHLSICDWITLLTHGTTIDA